ncbi:hypothetical protein J1N35_014684 [Gossypium stocksii]|uniref:Uncharacterized protein n=1 Tax=Gossypium stocksii TaxID=47602 RepID=A0A9D3VVK1_9ROSI|nr:hypothetical protein J1N35_014684 [Gossypium stocksii]
MSERVSAIIYYDGEVHNIENGVVFLSENIARIVFNQNIDLAELCKRIRRRIFGTTPMRVSSIKDDIFPTTSTGEGTSYVADNDGLDNEPDVDPPREPDPDGAKVTLFFKSKLVLIETEDDKGGLDEEEENMRFMTYSPLAHMRNVD